MTANKWDSVIDLDLLWKEYKRILKNEHSPVVLTASQPFTSRLVMSNEKWFRHEWIWIKNNTSNFLNAKISPLKTHESVIVFSKGRPLYNPQGLIEINKPMANQRKKSSENYRPLHNRPYVQSHTNYPKTLLEIGVERGLHPTQKPVALFEYLIRTYSNPGALVLDNCAGCGTTGVAAKNSGRDFILIEKDEKYAGICRTRLSSSIG